MRSFDGVTKTHSTMLTRTDILNYAKTNNLKTVEHFPQSYCSLRSDIFDHGQTNYAMADTQWDYKIAIETEDGIYYWFRVNFIETVIDIEEQMLWSDHIYSQRTGSSSKSFSRFSSIMSKIEAFKVAA